jgi:RNA polymerase sigma factor (sigma-70 family)
MKRGREEIERLIRTHYDLVKMTARRCFPRHFGDEDMLQCGLIGLWEAARRWNGRGDFLPLARRCVLNNMKDYVRAENRAAAIAARYREQRACPPRRSAPAGARDQERLVRRVWPADSRERLVLLALIRGESPRAAAARLGLDARAFRRLVLRGAKRLEEYQKTNGLRR